tara:strand:- start:322 stop:681 length:360 start_codon:yes stop_codon:yes gene_type:complete
MGSYEGVYGYLHPSDLGFLGIIFQYGVLGLLFFMVQYGLAWRAVKLGLGHMEYFGNPAFYRVCVGFLAIGLITAISTGSIAYNPEQLLLFIIFIRVGAHLNMHKIRARDNIVSKDSRVT